MIELRNKCALVTGGSAGLGASVARQLAEKGVNLVINYSNSKERAEVLAKELRDQYSVQVHVVQADVFGGNDALVQLVEKSVSLLGQLDIVISNAGWTKFVPFKDIDQLDDEIWDGCLNANVKTHFYLFRAAKKYLEASADGGTFIVSASLAGRRPYGLSMPYAVSKAALIHLVEILAKSQGPKIRVHSVCPGLLLTEWGQKFSQEVVDLAIESSPIKTVADVDETAAHFVFLCQISSSTGTTVGVDAGLYL
ncbi:hypothetical protein PUMCH_000813 [Australozyma saopauloensis]|uniref:Granaticin polyketide synthase ketoacyl reductase 2 n=1 Tax=Australozyma saopauloensis TaxID=291208 RepID=A0AAX4H556_9ASCO|nr:hypothetical protein PUMCH_000813 [[Candida] saopauloensis]